MPLFLDHFDLVAHLERQRDWSARMFGAGARREGISEHIRKELLEIAQETEPLKQLGEWVDVIILALDGAWRTGAPAGLIAGSIAAKQRINEERKWPTHVDATRPTEHIRGGDADELFECGARVAFLGQQQPFTVKSVGRRSLNHGLDLFLELEELPGEFAPHLFRRIE